MRHENQYGPHAYYCYWLRETGLRETRWIVDIVWLMDNHMTFNEWIYETTYKI